MHDARAEIGQHETGEKDDRILPYGHRRRVLIYIKTASNIERDRARQLLRPLERRSHRRLHLHDQLLTVLTIFTRLA